MLLVWVIVDTTRELWRGVGPRVALLVAAALSLLFVVAWRSVPLNDWRRVQIASVLLFVAFVVSYVL